MPFEGIKWKLGPDYVGMRQWVVYNGSVSSGVNLLVNSIVEDGTLTVNAQTGLKAVVLHHDGVTAAHCRIHRHCT